MNTAGIYVLLVKQTGYDHQPGSKIVDKRDKKTPGCVRVTRKLQVVSEHRGRASKAAVWNRVGRCWGTEEESLTPSFLCQAPTGMERPTGSTSPQRHS